MQHAEFTIGDTFWCSDRQWRCTDIGINSIQRAFAWLWFLTFKPNKWEILNQESLCASRFEALHRLLSQWDATVYKFHPVWFWFSWKRFWALSHGDGHIVVVEPSARVATPFDPGFQSNGGLVIGKGLHTLRVRAGMQNWSHVEIMVDVNTWKAVQGANRIARKMAILDWQLHMLPDNRLDPQPTPFFSFRG